MHVYDLIDCTSIPADVPSASLIHTGSELYSNLTYLCNVGYQHTSGIEINTSLIIIGLIVFLNSNYKLKFKGLILF